MNEIRRAHRLTLEIEGDDLQDLVDVLRDIELRLYRDELATGTTIAGGYGSGWIATYDVDESITHERYVAALNARLDSPAPGQQQEDSEND